MGEYILGNTANDVWKEAAKHIMDYGKTEEGRSGEVKELLHTFITIKDPKQRWVYDRIPPLSIGYALAEIVWIISGDDRSEIINTWNPILKKYAGESSHYHGAYGKRIRAHFGFDQLEEAYYCLQSCPESRQVVIQIYDTKADFPEKNGQPRDNDIPCNICSLLKVRNNKLEWMQVMRSNDILLGTPYNFVQFTSIQEILSGWLGIDVGSYNHYSDSLHLYNGDINKIGINVSEPIVNTDSLALRKENSEILFKEIYKRMEALAGGQTSEREIYSLALINSEYSAYNNVMLILAAYVANKYKYIDLSRELVKQCTNKAYIVMWTNWINYRNKQ